MNVNVAILCLTGIITFEYILDMRKKVVLPGNKLYSSAVKVLREKYGALFEFARKTEFIYFIYKPVAFGIRADCIHRITHLSKSGSVVIP